MLCFVPDFGRCSILYIDSRKVKNFDSLMSLIVCDRVKNLL